MRCGRGILPTNLSTIFLSRERGEALERNVKHHSIVRAATKTIRGRRDGGVPSEPAVVWTCTRNARRRTRLEELPSNKDKPNLVHVAISQHGRMPHEVRRSNPTSD